MPTSNIILTGFMATGKSTLGRRLAKRIGYRFIDTDAEIEKRSGQAIAEIFETQGEASFRRLESELVKELAGQQRLVVATGGGLVMNPENVAALEKTGRIICLTAPPEEILARVTRQKQTRPLLDDPDPQSKISALLQQRARVYQQFPQLDTSQHPPEKLIEKLLLLVQQT